MLFATNLNKCSVSDRNHKGIKILRMCISKLPHARMATVFAGKLRGKAPATDRTREPYFFFLGRVNRLAGMGSSKAISTTRPSMVTGPKVTCSWYQTWTPSSVRQSENLVT